MVTPAAVALVAAFFAASSAAALSLEAVRLPRLLPVIVREGETPLRTTVLVALPLRDGEEGRVEDGVAAALLDDVTEAATLLEGEAVPAGEPEADAPAEPLTLVLAVALAPLLGVTALLGLRLALAVLEGVDVPALDGVPEGVRRLMDDTGAGAIPRNCVLAGAARIGFPPLL